jgi:hypothetical protein
MATLKQLFSDIAPLLFILGIAMASCQKSAHNEKRFTDLPGTETGVLFENKLSYSESFNMIDYLYYYDGGGVAIGDINNDGLSDIYLVANEGDNALYLNLGDMQFRDISQSAGIRSPGLWKTGVSMVDVNGDGLLDIYLCRLGDYKGVTGNNELYINQGDLTFTEEAARYNLDFKGFSTQAAFFDMDNDGDLDAYLLNHSVHTENSFGDSDLRMEVDSLAGDRLYRNDGNYFTDVSAHSGIYRSQLGYGLGIALSDINQDGFTDIFVANDFMENDFLYLNNQDGTFTEVYSQMADYASLSSMGCDLADFNNDGLVDIITLDMLPQNQLIGKSTVGEDPLKIFQMKLQMGYMPQYKRNMLQLNRGDGTFSDIAMLAGIHATDWSWAPLFADLDNDGWKDLFITNGIKGRPNDLDYLKFINSKEATNNPDLPDSVLYQHMPGGEVANYFYRNNGDLTFEDFSDKWGTVNRLITNGAAYGDLDNDGDLDLVVNNLDTSAFIKENTMIPDSAVHFLQLNLIGTGLNSKAIGAKIEVFYGSHHQYYELFPTRGFKSSVDYRIHIGLGKTNQVDSVVVSWPNGGSSTLRALKSDQLVTITQSENGAPAPLQDQPNPLFTSMPSSQLGIDYVHLENDFIEFNREPLIPHMHSREGPAHAIGDINGDGLDDLFIGGAKHQPGSLYLQSPSGFKHTQQPAFFIDKVAEDVDATFFDFDQDGDQDLVVVSGGNEFQEESDNRKPRLYVNDGQGNFNKSTVAFPGVYQTGSCVAIHDYDGDSWPDIFLGSLVVPWNFGIAPKSYLLKNDRGKGFIDRSDKLPNQGAIGMINDAKWIDLDGNNTKSLVLAGEWMDVMILDHDQGSFRVNSIPNSAGWWKSLDHVDYDNDGDQDLLMGNMGLNSKIKASKQEPVNLYLEDFDQNGKLDAIMTITSDGAEFIFNTGSALQRQIPSIGSSLAADDLDLAEAIRLSVVELRSGVFINDGKSFHFQPFPNLMQVSFIQDFLVADLDKNGSPDILSVGNLYPATMQEGRYASSRGALLTGFPQSPQVLAYSQTGISIRGDTRGVDRLNFQGQDLILIAQNDDSIMWLKQR